MSQWWRDAVIYQVYPRSFADSNGDGMGDMPGIREKLPYLAKLGVDAVWLSPFYTSPMHDGGYDVADFRDVDPMFGGLADFDRMVTEAHRLGLRVIVDIVPNHCSTEHEWFKAALAAGPGSPERERFHFRDSPDGPPNNWPSIFGGPAWTQVPDGQWYLHLFDSSQPDFNWDNPEIHAEFLDVLKFWLDRGVDGFRIDVAHGMVKEPGLPDLPEDKATELLGGSRTPYLDVDGVHEIYRAWRQVLNSYEGDRMAVAEAWVETPERRARYVRGDELHQAFNFDLLKSDFSATEYRKVIDAEMSMANSVGAVPTWVLSNHDRYRHVTRFGDGPLGLARARAATLTMLALPGSSYLYQGEELGLPEVLDLPEDVLQDPVWERSGHTDRGRDGCRVPLPWKRSGPSFGFGPGDSWLPQPGDWGSLSAEAQDGTEGSTLEFYREALRLRREHRPQALIWSEGANGDVLAFSNGALRCVTNFGDSPIRLDGEVLLSSSPLVDGQLPGNAAAWIR
ncbi:glycoside hydrolase family 13 protein [Stackebrandtia nassauensis]|uniref:Alpha amylase catalytic region n=1 Tax=Stackebrandtia nassauensis (strain DSM 44728 / CIP 108903 / NRRL B-16338 / NBRC 102104 / LLR-40K-21) TaxID=446470 RepID=D3PZ92_STANL|nr:glycoside hydrolase family 13 protein [Stackebrandtia nassauensis]ADD45521.1 alpha amylase catalytic region [Stackebrandtia nassauensis DSM 44728]